ncbi:MAG: Flp pilus assembly complex ATPase component TadA [Deltaproteobacteria bacterium]|nr:Flp pilus assembly complex ATPase component TadA [Deltaproteobacteria bacterium]
MPGKTDAKKTLSLDYVADVLLKMKLISADERKEIFIKGDLERAKLHKLHESAYSRRRLHSIHEAISPAEVIAAFNFKIQGTDGKPLNEDSVTEALAVEIGMPYRKIDPLKLNLDVVTSKIPRPFAQRHLMVPVEEKDGVVTMAVADPFNLEPIENLKRTTRMKIRLVLASKTDILRIVREFFGFRSSVVAAEKQMGGAIDLGNLEQYVKLKGASEIEATDQHIVNAVEYLLHYAYDQRSSDIHIEPKRNSSLVRLRIDGVLHNIHTIPRLVHPSIISRIKMLSRMDIAEKRRPQDGRIKTEFRGREIELRISTLPTAFGEKVVIRIFDPDILCQELQDLGFYPREFELFNSYLKRTNGVILVTGPTGSGKTTTLYSALKSLASPEVNIVTIEDPIEMVMEEFNQVGVQPQIGVDFASILRTILRQDPDIIMVGEIRDRETANNAVQAALTGHLVLSTLHTNDAPGSVVRLTDLGVPSFLISATVFGIAAQRLVRRICKDCRSERSLKPEEAASLDLPPKEYRVSYGEGCTECRGTGYRGRTGIFEMMDVSERVKALILKNVDIQALQKAAREEGMVTLRECAVKKMLEGITTYEEVMSVTS